MESFKIPKSKSMGYLSSAILRIADEFTLSQKREIADKFETALSLPSENNKEEVSDERD